MPTYIHAGGTCRYRFFEDLKQHGAALHPCSEE
jgi:hypothetical protein